MQRFIVVTLLLIICGVPQVFSQIRTLEHPAEGASVFHNSTKERYGQTFMIGGTEAQELISISVKLTDERLNGGLLAFDLYTLNGNGLNFIASSQTKGYLMDQVNELVFPDGVILQPGTTYAFLCRNTGRNIFHLASADGNPYPAGNAFFSNIGTNSPYQVNYNPVFNTDLYFNVKMVAPCERRPRDIQEIILAGNSVQNNAIAHNPGRRRHVGQTFHIGDLSKPMEIGAIEILLNGEPGNGGLLYFDLYKLVGEEFQYVASSRQGGYYLNAVNRLEFEPGVYFESNTTYAFMCKNRGLNYFSVSAFVGGDIFQGGTAFVASEVSEDPKSFVFDPGSADGADLVFKVIPRQAYFQVINAGQQELLVQYMNNRGEAGEPSFRVPAGTTNAVQFASVGENWLVTSMEDGEQRVVAIEVPIQTFRYEPPHPEGIPPFYAQIEHANGYPIVASGNVNPYALKEAQYLINMLLAQRRDIREAMIKSGSRISILAYDEFTTDQPEWSYMGNTPENKKFWDKRARGLGGSEVDPYCSCAEENLLCYEGDPYWEENILIHEFAHNIHLRGLVNVDPTFDKRLQAVFTKAMKKGLWEGKYAANNRHEYFAEGVQSWFDNNRENDHDHNHVNTRQELIEYDPDLANLCKEVFGNTRLKYTKPTTRLSGHMEGYDPSTAPTFEWPLRLRD